VIDTEQSPSAAMLDATTFRQTEESALDMVPRGENAPQMVVRTGHWGDKVSALGTEQWKKDAATRDAQTESRKGEFVSSTEQRLANFAVLRDAPIKPRREGSVMGTGKGRKGQSAVAKDALTMPRMEVPASNMAQRSQLAAMTDAPT